MSDADVNTHTQLVPRLCDFADSHPHMHDELPLVHSTLCDSLGYIAETGALLPRDCPVFNEPLVYLFYGRPAYRSKLGQTPDTEIKFCPVCFVLKPNRIQSNLRRVFPFDSGAAKNNLFAPLIKDYEADVFGLTPSLEAIRRFTNVFFESNGKYFLGAPRSHLVLPPDQATAAQYYQLVEATGTAPFDDRRSAIELQYQDAILLKDTLWAVILPLDFLEQSALRSRIVRDWGAFPITYPTFHGAIPSASSEAIRILYHRWLTEGGFLP